MKELARQPEGWTVATLGQVCSKAQYGWTTKANADGGTIHLLRTTDITSGEIDWNSVPYCTDTPDDIDKYTLRPNDIVISRAGSVGVSCRLRDVPSPTVFASYLIRFCPLEPIEPRYVALFLQTRQYWSAITERSSGIALQNVNARKLQTIEIPIAPAQEQRRIGAKIEELFSMLDAGVAALERVRANLKRYRAAVLNAAFEGELTREWRVQHPDVEPASVLLERILEERRRKWEEEQLAKYAKQGKKPSKNWKSKYKEPAAPDIKNLLRLPDGWGYVTLGACATLVTKGSTPTTYGHEYKKSGIAFVRTENLADGYIDTKSITAFIDEAADEALKRSRLQAGDLLFSIAGTIGRAALVLEGDVPANTNQAIALIRGFQPVLAPAFLRLVLASLFVQNQAAGDARGGAMDNISLGDVRALEILVPPLNEQHGIVTAIEQRLFIVDEIEKQVNAGLTRSARLRQSILKRAFEGRLVPQDPSDEPASVLLQRIAQELEANASTKSKGKHKRTKQAELPM